MRFFQSTGVSSTKCQDRPGEIISFFPKLMLVEQGWKKTDICFLTLNLP